MLFLHLNVLFITFSCFYSLGCYVKWCCNCSVPIFGTLSFSALSLVLQKDLFNGKIYAAGFLPYICRAKRFTLFPSRKLFRNYFSFYLWSISVTGFSFPCRYATFSTKTLHLASLSSYTRHMHHFLHNLHITIGFYRFTMSSSHHSRWLLWEFLIKMYLPDCVLRYVTLDAVFVFA